MALDGPRFTGRTAAGPPPSRPTSPSAVDANHLAPEAIAARPDGRHSRFGGSDAPASAGPTEATAGGGRIVGLPPPGMLLGWALALAGLALGVLLCALALAALIGVASLASGPWRPMSDQLSTAVTRAGDVAAGAGQAAADLLDPRHPPREPLRLDTELDALTVVGVSSPVGVTAGSQVTLASVVKRADALDAATAQYAVVRRTFLEPQARRILGLPLGTDRGEQEHYLYQGQSFRLGPHYYKVNWVSLDRQQVAIARYRSADGVIGRLAFEYD